MTNPVKDISCHRNLLLSSLPAPFLQSYLALFTDHSPSFNLFCFLTSLPFLLLYFSRLCPSTNNQIPVMPLASLDALQFLDHAGQFLGLDSVQNESGPAAVVPFSKGGGGPFGNINPGSGAAVPNTSPVHQQHPSKALEAASFWQWARWRVLGAAWLTYIILFQHSFLFSFFTPSGPQTWKSSRLSCHFAKGPVHKYRLPHDPGHPFLLCKADHRTRVCCYWLTNIVCMSDYIGTVQFSRSLFWFSCFLLTLKGQLVAHSGSQTSQCAFFMSCFFSPVFKDGAKTCPCLAF